MKRLFIFILAAGLSISAMAQETAKDYKRAAQDAFKAQDFKTALVNYEKAIDLQEADNIVDTALYFNTAVSALKSENFESGAKYFKKCTELQYKALTCYKQLGKCQQQIGDYDNMKTDMEKAVALFPDDATCKQFLASAYLFNARKKCDEGSIIIKAAEPLKSDVEKYNAEIAKAKESFKEALPDAEKAFQLNPTSKPAATALYGIYTNLEMKSKAAEIKTKLATMK